ncbi:MAG TPA: TIGR03936 family radical SAM-associated protein [Elusimicrobiales bacterium]|nr:TIGR03936 family radical SAM-associated protein [Elusimicrobiales bacterium]
MNEGPKSIIRLKFARLRPAADFTHLEQIKTFRARATASGLKFWPAKTGGGVIPRMAFGPAVSVGHESLCEYADLYLEEFVRDEAALEKIQPLDDDKFRLLSARRIPVFFPSIEAAVNAAEYFLEADFPAGFSQVSLDAFMALKSVPYEKVKPSGERKALDARTPLLAASWDAPSSLLKLTLRLAPGKTIKPETVSELIAGGAPVFRRIVRKELYWMDSQGKLEVF